MNLSTRLQKSCIENSEKLAVKFEHEQINYIQLWHRILGFAKELRQIEIKPKERVGLLMENSIDFVVSYFAILAAGAIVIPIETMAVPREIQFILQNAKAKRLITSPLFQQVIEPLKMLLPDLIILSAGKETTTEYHIPIIKETALAVCIYTSGTTGVPKGAQLTHQNLLANTDSCIEVLQSTINDRFLCILPLFHSFAATVCMLTPLMSGATMVPMKMFRPEMALHTIEKEKITLLAAVPSMFLAMAKAEPNTVFDLSCIKYCISGGAGLPLQVMELFESRFGIKIHEGYGLSEASPVVALNPLGGLRKPRSIGVPIPNVKMRIVDENMNDMPIGEIGEIAVQGKNVMKGYLGLPDITKKTIRNGWLLTGDLGYQDSDGYFYVVDRKKEMILVRGLNVYPREVENVLYTHSAVLEAAVIAVKDERSGEVPKAVIVPKTPGKISEQEIIAFCRDKLAAYKIPKHIEFRESLPKTSSGKILKRALT